MNKIIVFVFLSTVNFCYCSDVTKSFEQMNRIYNISLSKDKIVDILNYTENENKMEVYCDHLKRNLYLSPFEFLIYKSSADAIFEIMHLFIIQSAQSNIRNGFNDINSQFFMLIAITIEKYKQWTKLKHIIKISNNFPDGRFFSHHLLRKIIYLLIELENTYVLIRLHSNSTNPSPHDNKFSSYPQLYLCQPEVADEINKIDNNGMDIKLNVLIDILNKLVISKELGGNMENEMKNVLKSYISFYSNSKIIPIPPLPPKPTLDTTNFLDPFPELDQIPFSNGIVKRFWIGSSLSFDVAQVIIKITQKNFHENFEYIMDISKDIFEELKITYKPGLFIRPTSIPPLHKSTKDKKRLRFSDEIIESDQSNFKKGNFLDPHVKSCSDLAFLIINNHSEEFILNAMKYCKKPLITFVNKLPVSTISLLFKYNRFSLIDKMISANVINSFIDLADCKIDQLINIFNYFLQHRKINNIILLLSHKELFLKLEYKNILFHKLLSAFLNLSISKDDLLKICNDIRVISDIDNLSSSQEGLQIQKLLLNKLLRSSDFNFLRMFSSLQWFIKEDELKILAKEQFMNAANNNLIQECEFWIQIGKLSFD